MAIRYEQLGHEAHWPFNAGTLYNLYVDLYTEEAVSFNDKAVGGSLTMTSVQMGLMR